MKKILLVGAGAVGQIFGYHLQKGGAEVSFFVKEKYAEETRRGFNLYNLSSGHRHVPIRFEGFGVVSRTEEVAAQKWDQVYLCMSSTGLRVGDWLKDFGKAIGAATLVVLQPGIEDRDYALNYVRKDQVVSGMITLVSYHAPLPTETFAEPGTAYWLPPLSPNPFSGPKARVAEVVDALKAGGQPAKGIRDVPTMVAFPSAALMVLLTGLEASHWSFERFASSSELKLACDAIDEAMRIVSNRLNVSAPMMRHAFKPALLKTVLRVAPHVVPFPMEIYFKAHFTKVRDQTRLAMRTYIDQGRKVGLPTEALLRLEGLLGRPAVRLQPSV